jgi:hypothetical protein
VPKPVPATTGEEAWGQPPVSEQVGDLQGADSINIDEDHQDAFAADYQEDEYALLGMAIKYAGLRGKEVRVIKNRQTLGEEGTIQ